MNSMYSLIKKFFHITLFILYLTETKDRFGNKSAPDNLSDIMFLVEEQMIVVRKLDIIYPLVSGISHCKNASFLYCY